MALVRYNRNYTVQSGPRQPARRNPGALPDAAGAFLRGSSGIHEGDMAVGRALLASNEARTKREMARAADAGRHWQEAGRIVAAAGKGLGEIADAYQRAQARKVASEIDGIEAAQEACMIRNSDAIYNEPWKEEKGETVAGPLVKFGKVKDEFYKSDAWTNASDAAKKGAKARLDARFMVYEAKAERKQDEARRAEWQARADEKNRADGAAVATFFDIGDRFDFKNKLGIAVASQKNSAMVRIGALKPVIGDDGTLEFVETERKLTSEEQKAIDDAGAALERHFRTERLKHWFAQLEDPDSDAEVLRKAIDGEINEKNFPADDARLALERARDASVKRRDANVAAIAEGAVVAATLDPATVPDPAAAFSKERQRAKGISSPALRAKVLAGIDKADADLQFNGFLDGLDKMEETNDANDGENAFSTDAWFAAAMNNAEQIPNPYAKDRAVSWLLTGKAEQDEKRATELLSRVLTGYGYDKEGTPVPLTPAQRASDFRDVWPRLTPTQRREYGDAIRKSALSGATVSLADIDEIGRAAGVENLSSFFAPPQPGKDPTLAKDKIHKDGTVTLDPAGLGNKFAMPADAMMDMVDAIRQYKAAVAVAGDRAGIKKPDEIWSAVLAKKNQFKGFCVKAQQRAIAEALAEYERKFPLGLMPKLDDER